MDYLTLISRCAHVSSAILWVGLLYFFNWVNGPFLASLEGETKRRVMLGLLPRALFWFRWAAAWTWVSGLLVIGLVFYHSRPLMFAASEDGGYHWTWRAGVIVALTFTGHHLYDALAKTVFKDFKVAFFGGWALASGFFVLAREFGGFSDRGALMTSPVPVLPPMISTFGPKSTNAAFAVPRSSLLTTSWRSLPNMATVRW